MLSYRYLVVALLFIAGTNTTLISSALGQDDLNSARAHYSKGTRLYDVGEYQQALREFKAAHVAKPDPAFLYNVAQCHRQLGELDQAVVMYKRYLAASPNAANRAEVEKRIAEIEIGLDAEKRTLASEGSGGYHASASNEPMRSSGMPLTSNPMTIDGSSETPSMGVGVAQVAHTPAVGSETSSLPSLRWLGVGVTAALAGGALIAGISTSTKYNELKKSCGQTVAGCSDHDIDGVRTRALVTNLLLGAAVVSAVGTGILIYLTPQAATAQIAWRF